MHLKKKRESNLARRLELALFLYILTWSLKLTMSLTRKYLTNFAAQNLNTSLLSPYLDSLGSTFSNGANFAIAGSATLPKYVPFALNIQVMQFKHFKDRSAELAATGDFLHFLSKINYFSCDRIKVSWSTVSQGWKEVAALMLHASICEKQKGIKRSTWDLMSYTRICFSVRGKIV